MSDAPQNEALIALEAELGEALARRTPQIVEAWLQAVRSDERLTTADTLPEPQLRDHVPKVIESFVHYFQSGAKSPDQLATDSARLHGAERWLQGYTIRELLLEMYWLRRTLFREVTQFAAGRKGELALNASISDSVDRFLNDLESRTVAMFVDESEAALKKSTDARLRLVRIVSHELRNMLNSVGFASSLLEVGDAESIQRIRESLDHNTGHMKELLDDLLGLSTIISRSATVKVAPFDPSVVMKLIEDTYRSRAESKGLRFRSAMAVGLKELSTDELKMRQILENLVSNAVQFTYSGEISVSLEESDERHFEIVVKDTGLGIAAENRQLIFTEFYQVKPESPLRGFGLGLAIVSGLVELLHGTISLTSEPNGGSMFRVKLPCSHTG